LDQNNKRKLIDQLTFADYLAHPIWTFYDDDGDEVVPVQYPGWASEAVGGEGTFIICDFILSDGTRLPGVVGINIYLEIPHVFEFLDTDGRLVAFSVNRKLETAETRQKLAQFLGKTVDQVFPIRYVTPYILRSGRLLAGEHK